MQIAGRACVERMEALDRVASALAAALKRLEERERNWITSTPPPATAKTAGFEKFQERLANLTAYPGQIARQLDEVDFSLRGGEESLRHWLNRAEAVRKNLAEWEGRAVG